MRFPVTVNEGTSTQAVETLAILARSDAACRTALEVIATDKDNPNWGAAGAYLAELNGGSANPPA